MGYLPYQLVQDFFHQQHQLIKGVLLPMAGYSNRNGSTNGRESQKRNLFSSGRGWYSMTIDSCMYWNHLNLKFVHEVLPSICTPTSIVDSE